MRLLTIEIRSLDHIYIATSRYEFFYSRNDWFKGSRGQYRHWTLDRKHAPAEGAI